jgi:predicted NUDIX family NTP pyrophosphohydrolase
MPSTSAGILMYRRRGGSLEVLLGHFGGPFWSNRDEGAWAIPKGLIEPGESAEAAARREFEEEIGTAAAGPLLALGTIRQKGGKSVEAFALERDLDADRIESNRFTVEWPPRSGQFRSYPEIDRAGWFPLEEAEARILPSQRPLLGLLAAALR